MIILANRTKLKGMNIEVQDAEGNTEVFNSLREVCAALRCTNSYVYQALRTGRKISGCNVRVIEQ